MHNTASLLLPVLLYAETHFRFFRFFPSIIYKKEPEIIFDLPRRLDPSHDLPVILLFNDIKKFHAECVSVEIVVSKPSKNIRLFKYNAPNKHIVTHSFSSQCTLFIFTIPRNELETGDHFINCKAIIKKKKRLFSILNDNLFGSSKLPFSCFVADNTLPGKEYCSYGDLHVHSQYSQSHVEFGAPIAIIDIFSRCYGTDFTVITDHSYDIACSMDNYLQPDESCKRWQFEKDDISKNKKSILIQGEEISCLNSRNKAVHLCGIGLKDYIYGTMDGARKNNNIKKQLTIYQTIDNIHKQNGVAFAAHPGSRSGFMQKIFLKRGNWNVKDFTMNIDGIQAVNNGFKKTWNRAKVLWIKELLKGHKLSLVAGNDSHGDFNRYRYLAIPFISIKEMFDRYFNSTLTGIYSEVTSQQDVIECLKNGKTFVTAGPFLNIGLSENPHDSIISNHDTTLNNRPIYVHLISTYEFGLPYAIRLFSGEYNNVGEKIIYNKTFSGQNYSYSEKISSIILNKNCYLRAEAKCRKQSGEITFCATSPCYITKAT
jgi:predicted metal-dependent phosphoesterase TrpH